MNVRSISAIATMGIAILLNACGGNKNDAINVGDYNLSVNEKLNGPLSESYKVNKSILKISDQSFGTKLLVEVERTGSDLPFDANDVQVCGVGSGKTYEWCISADVLGENDLPVETNLDKYGYDPFEKMLSLKESETIWLEFSLSYNSELESSPEKAQKVKLTSSLEEDDNTVYSTSSESSSNKTNVALNNNEDWDEMLNDYEDYVDEYIKVYKKAIKGDNSAMMEYPELLEKATELQGSMEQAKGDMSSTQVSRMMKIQTKLARAAM